MTNLLRHIRVTLLALFVFASAQFLQTTKKRRSKVISTPPRVLLIGAYGNGNFGDDVIGQAIAEGVKGHGSVLIAARLHDTSRLAKDVAETVVVGGGLSSLVKTWKLASRSDLAILGGGGLLEGRPDDVNVHRLILEYLGKLAVCGLRGQRIAIHGIGISPNLYSNPLVNVAVRAMFKAINVIGVRDPASLAAVRRNGGTATLIKDPAIVLFEGWARQVQKTENSVGVVLLDHYRWPTFSKADSVAEGTREEELQELVNQLILRCSQGKQIKIFSFHWSDKPMGEDVVKLFTECGGNSASVDLVSYKQPSSESPFKLLMACEEVLTMRFHPALAALSSNAKVKVIGSLQKLEQLRASAVPASQNWQYPPEYGDPLEQLQAVILGRDVVMSE